MTPITSGGREKRGAQSLRRDLRARESASRRSVSLSTHWASSDGCMLELTIWSMGFNETGDKSAKRASLQSC